MEAQERREEIVTERFGEGLFENGALKTDCALAGGDGGWGGGESV